MRRQQGAGRDWDAGPTYQRARDSLERARRNKTLAAKTTLRRQNRLHDLQREIEAAKCAEQEEDAVATTVEEVWDRARRTTAEGSSLVPAELDR